MKTKPDQLALLLVALSVNAFFIIYQALAWLVLPASLIMLIALLWYGFNKPIVLIVALALFSLSAIRLYRYSRESSTRKGETESRSKFLIEHFIAWIGTLKYFSRPLCVVEDPGSYRIKGQDIRQLLDGDVLQPGDILLRGYQGYVDGELIRRTGGGTGAASYFSHAALYLGPVDAKDDRRRTAERLQVRENGDWRAASDTEKDAIRNSPDFFQPGRQMVAHSMARGVHLEDILTFLRCDYLVVLRLPPAVQIGSAGGELHAVFRDTDGDGDLEAETSRIDCRLSAGEAVERAEIIASARHAALGCIGVGYDFLFEECHSFHRFSCSEFVYFCFKGIHRYIGLQVTKHSFAGMFARRTISPPDIYNAAVKAGKLEVVWCNVPGAEKTA